VWACWVIHNASTITDTEGRSQTGQEILLRPDLLSVGWRAKVKPQSPSGRSIRCRPSVVRGCGSLSVSYFPLFLFGERSISNPGRIKPTWCAHPPSIHEGYRALLIGLAGAKSIGLTARGGSLECDDHYYNCLDVPYPACNLCATFWHILVMWSRCTQDTLDKNEEVSFNHG